MVKAANKVRVLKDYDIIKEGDTANSFVVELLKNGEVVDLTGATVTWKMANEKGVVVDKQATVEDNQVHLILTEDDQTGDGKMRVEIRVEKDGKVDKYPSYRHQEFYITQTLDNLKNAPVSFATIDFFNSKINEIKNDSTQAKTTAAEAKQMSESTQEQLDTIVIEGDSSVEAAQARKSDVDGDNQNYPNLKARLDTQIGNVNSQLAQTETQVTESKRALNYYWIPETQPPARVDEPNYFMDAFSKNADEYIANHFEPLRLASPEYITRKSLGKDQSNTYDIWKYDFTPPNYKKTIIITSCLHGGEITLMAAMVRFLNYLVYEWEKYPNLAYIRENIRIVYVPIANPWGVSQKPRTRQNSNGVDLNRNFDYKWVNWKDGQPFDHDYKGTAPFSEKETQIIRDLVQSYPDAISFLDLHNTGTTNRDYFVYLPESYPHQTYEQLVSYFTKDMSDPIVLLNRNSYPTLSNYLFHVKGIPSSHPEWCDIRFGVRQYDAIEITKAVEWISNTIMEHCKDFNANVNIKGASVSNIMVNGGFSTDASGWSRYGMGTPAVANNVLSASGATGNLTPSLVGSLTQTNIPSGTKIFTKAKFNCPPNCIKVELKLRDFTSAIDDLISSISNPESGVFIELSGEYTFTKLSEVPSIQIRFHFPSQDDVVDKIFSIQEVLAMNITNDFSNYNLSNDEIDFIFEQTGSWFGGTREITFIENSSSMEKNQRDITMYLLNKIWALESNNL